MIVILEHPEGCVVPVRVQPGARRSGIQGEQAGSLKIAVTAPPQDSKANRAVIEVMSESLGIRRSQIELISGAPSRSKKLLVRGTTKTELEVRIQALLTKE
ncbi:MAG TPA: DUF167 domain-containing protein [Gemmataceae bacterium]|nr:DUF167 domain-containing protein [Gemmataceae bacterium]